MPLSRIRESCEFSSQKLADVAVPSRILVTNYVALAGGFWNGAARKADRVYDFLRAFRLSYVIASLYHWLGLRVQATGIAISAYKAGSPAT